MSDGYHGAWLETKGRVSNEKLCAWLGADAASDSRSFQLLFQAMTPLLFAFFEGQLQGRKADLDRLVMETLVEVYQRRASYERSQPFRAWLLGLARLRAASYLRGEHGRSAFGKARDASPSDADSECMNLLRKLALGQVSDPRHECITTSA